MQPLTLNNIYLSNISALHTTLHDLSVFYHAHQHDDRSSLYQKIMITTGRSKHRKQRAVFIPIHPEHKQLHIRLGKLLPGPYHDAVFSYVKQKSRRDAALCHAGSYEIYGIDIQDFFPSITESLITELYTQYLRLIVSTKVSDAFILSDATAADFARMIAWSVTLPHPTKPDAPECVLTLGNEVAPQIARMVLYGIDDAISTAAKLAGVRYSRYSDNLYLSHPTMKVPDELKQLLTNLIEQFSYTRQDGQEHHPFRLHPDKIRSKYYFKRQQILGVTVNHHATLSVDRIERTRHALHNLFCTMLDLSAKMREQSISSLDAQTMFLTCTKRKNTVFGYLNECAAIDREKYERKFLRKRIATKAMLDEVERSLNRYALRPEVADVVAEA